MKSTDEYYLPEKDDAPWLNCMDGLKMSEKEPTHEEMLEIAEKRERKNFSDLVEELQLPSESTMESVRRLSKKETVLEIANQGIEKYKEALEELADAEKPFYRFFACEYFGTGEGMSFWLKICRNYPPYDNVDRELEKFKEFIGHSFYYPGIEEPTEGVFMAKYINLIPHHIKVCIERRDQPILTWETHFHVNYS